MLLKNLFKTSVIAVGLSALLTVSACCEELDTIRLSKGSLKLALDPLYGGRITEFSYDERDLLAVPEPGANSFGSTFWLSPQTLWSWPPIPEHDTAPYTVSVSSADSTTVTSDYGAGARIHKTVTLNSGQSATVRYRIDTERDFPEIAAWEITRVPNRGLAFAPVTTDSVKTVRGTVAYEIQQDTLWLPMEDNAPLVEGKVIANGTEGWLAYVLEDLLYLKVYPQVAMHEMATGEGDMELYLSGELPYLELEVQSAAQNLKRGETLEWSVEWLVTDLPKDLEIYSGSPALLDFVRTTIKQASYR